MINDVSQKERKKWNVFNCFIVDYILGPEVGGKNTHPYMQAAKKRSQRSVCENMGVRPVAQSCLFFVALSIYLL